MGPGTWTGASENPLCFYFYDETEPFYRIYNCCDLVSRELAESGSTELTDCRQCLLGKDC